MGCGASTAKKPSEAYEKGPESTAHATSGGHIMPLTPEKHELLKAAFTAMDADGDGQIDMGEFKTRAATLGTEKQSVEELFKFFDTRGAAHRNHRDDDMLSIDEWISGVREMAVQRGLTDETFKAEMEAIMATCKALDGKTE